MSAYNFSGPAEILRAEQKDEELCERINRHITDFLLKYKGHIYINKNKNSILSTSKILYYGLTTLSRLQTLGEEYTRIIQVRSSGKHVPSVTQTIGMISVHIFGHQILEYLLSYTIKYVRKNEHITHTAKSQILYSLNVFKSILPLIQSLNRILFYWNSNFYTWAKRIFNIRYIFAVPWYHSEKQLHVFKILSILSAIHVGVLIIITLFNNKQVLSQSEGNLTPTTTSSISKCSLCLEKRTNTSLTVCGHLFCWNCIHEWLQTNKFCPLCRKVLDPRKIIPLQNYT
ncbi:peroxisome biogenesis factor 10 [Daktulosphaira vitifoliae]|uniref:peroxisome biogenesis factor 10 n=1 Tax=Daktulosphaira vitifoliae TaxID=58002 RepID=UPI0021AA908D|nr:peroxisome biogenesis factor 10 [Daktulosphaira vitifoliae]